MQCCMAKKGYFNAGRIEPWLMLLEMITLTQPIPCTALNLNGIARSNNHTCMHLLCFRHAAYFNAGRTELCMAFELLLEMITLHGN